MIRPINFAWLYEPTRRTLWRIAQAHDLRPCDRRWFAGNDA